MSFDDNFIWEGPDHTPRAVDWPEYLEWSKQGFDATKRVARTEVGEVSVSTVFLTIDHSWGGGPPVLFETMVFGLGDAGEPQWRYHTWAEAEAGHAKVVAAVQAGDDLDDLDVGC